MPIGQGAAAGIGAIGSMGGQIIANHGNRKLADQQAQWNIEQWERQNQRDDQLWNKQNAYNLQMWNMQNKYNSPQEQMARFKEAGLNPHLIYGKGTPGNAQSLQSNKQSAPGITPYNRPQMESVTRGMDVFGQYQSLKNLNAQTNNLEASNDAIKAETLLKQQQAILAGLAGDEKTFNLGISKELRNTSLEAARANLENIKKQNAKIGGDLNSQLLDQKLKNLKINRQKLGITENDPLWMRSLVQPELRSILESGLKKAGLNIPSLNLFK